MVKTVFFVVGLLASCLAVDAQRTGYDGGVYARPSPVDYLVPVPYNSDLAIKYHHQYQDDKNSAVVVQSSDHSLNDEKKKKEDSSSEYFFEDHVKPEHILSLLQPHLQNKKTVSPYGAGYVNRAPQYYYPYGQQSSFYQQYPQSLFGYYPQQVNAARDQPNRKVNRPQEHHSYFNFYPDARHQPYGGYSSFYGQPQQALPKAQPLPDFRQLYYKNYYNDPSLVIDPKNDVVVVARNGAQDEYYEDEEEPLIPEKEEDIEYLKQVLNDHRHILDLPGLEDDGRTIEELERNENIPLLEQMLEDYKDVLDLPEYYNDDE